MKEKKRLIFFAVLAALLLLIAALGKYLCPFDPYEQNLLLAKQPPGPEHWRRLFFCPNKNQMTR